MATEGVLLTCVRRLNIFHGKHHLTEMGESEGIAHLPSPDRPYRGHHAPMNIERCDGGNLGRCRFSLRTYFYEKLASSGALTAKRKNYSQYPDAES